jgi:hypothetical protein
MEMKKLSFTMKQKKCKSKWSLIIQLRSKDNTKKARNGMTEEMDVTSHSRKRGRITTLNIQWKREKN